MSSSKFKFGEMREEEDAETTDMNYNAPAKKCSVRYQDSRSNEKRSVRLQEKDQHLKSGKPVKQSDSGQHVDITGKFDTGNSFRHSSAGKQQKPWPSRKATGLEEVVKNMASVPSYLQCPEKGDINVQEKALNFGVLDWGSLERWTYLQKQMANRRGGNSPSGSNASSSPFSTVGSSSWSTRSNDSPLAQRKQSPSLEVQRTCPDYDTGKSRESGNSQSCQQKTEHSVQEQCSMIEGMRDHRQETVHKGRMSCDSAVESKGRSAEVDRSSFSASFRIDGIPVTDGCSHVSRSCPIPSTTQSGETVVDSSPVSGNEKSTPNTKGRHGKNDVLTDMSSGHSAVNMAARSGQNEVKVPTSLRRELSPHRLLRAGINRIRNSISREGSSGHQTKQTCSSAHEDDQQAANTRGRRSPLRRMLDPLLKTNNRSQFSGPIASSPSRRARETSNSNKLPIRVELELAKGSCRSSDASSNPSTGLVLAESASPVQDEKRPRSARQALMKLAWKNGLPLFMFSSSDDDIFAATVGRRSISEKSTFECIYTLFRAEEIRKTGGIWTGQGSNIKKQGLVYNVVGQMKVSPSKSTTAEDPKSYYREFVLFGAQLVPTGQPVHSLLNSELAAIVVKKVPSRRSSESSKLDALPQRSKCCNSSKTKLPEDSSCSCCQVAGLHNERNPENSSLSSIVAILPSAVHGSSTVGEPSPPLMERWRSGGSCDCGGWDEGCMLTVLTDRSRESISDCAPDGIHHRIELFNQGDVRARKHAFTMVAFKEGVYTVEFGPSIAALQAFAICIATLHCRTPTSIARLQANTLADHTRMAARKAERGPTNYYYVPDPAPLSPVRRT